MTLDGLLVEFVSDVRPHNGKDDVSIIFAPPGSIRTWLCISAISRRIADGTATNADISKYERTIAGMTTAEKRYEKGLYSQGMILCVEQKVENYKFLQERKSPISLNFFPSIAKEYLEHYHPELFD